MRLIASMVYFNRQGVGDRARRRAGSCQPRHIIYGPFRVRDKTRSVGDYNE